MKEILQSCPSSPGARVIVTDKVKHRILMPGSKCFVARCSGNIGPSPNMVVMKLVTTKNGKRGRDRADQVGVVTTLFPVEFEKRPLKSSRYRETPVVELVRAPFDTADVLDLDPVEFIGWAFAYKIYIRDLYSEAGIPDRWPAGKNYPINAFNNISYRIAKMYQETIGLLGSPEFRLPFVEQLRILESGIAQYILGERAMRARKKLEAIAYLITTDEKYKKGFYDLTQLKGTYNHYKMVLEAEQDLHYQISTKRWSSLPAKKREMIPSPVKPKKPVTVETLIKTIRFAIGKGKKIHYNRIILNDKNKAPAPPAFFGKAKEAEMFIEV